MTRTYTVDGGAAASSYTAPTADGSHTAVVTDSATAGNTASSTTLTFTLDKKIDVDLNTIEIKVVDGGAGANVEGGAGWGAQGDSLGGDAGAGQPATAGDAPAADGQGTAAGNDGAAPQRGW